MKYFWLIINWGLGVIFLLVGLSFMVEYPLAGLCLLIASALLIPPARNFSFKNTNLKIPTPVRGIAVFVLCVAFIFLLISSVVEESNEFVEKQAMESTEQDEVKRQKTVEEFGTNREGIISSIEKALSENKYDLVISETNKYLASGDEMLKKLQTTAKIGQLLAKLEKIPAEDFTKNNKIYRQLVSLDPENKKYKSKELFYAVKIQEAERTKNIQESKAVIDEVGVRLKKNSEYLKKYYGTTNQVKQATDDILKLAAIKALYEKSDKKDEKNLSSRASALMTNVSQQQRSIYASTTEEIFIKSGMDVKVSANGVKKDQLYLKYVLMSKPLVYKFQNEAMLQEQARVFGFKKITFTNGYNTWVVDL